MGKYFGSAITILERVIIVGVGFLTLYTFANWMVQYKDLNAYRSNDQLVDEFKASYENRFLRATQDKAKENMQEKAFWKALGGDETGETTSLTEDEKFLQAIQPDPFTVDEGDPVDNPVLMTPSKEPDSLSWRVTKAFRNAYIGQLTAEWRGVSAMDSSRPTLAILGAPQRNYYNIAVVETYALNPYTLSPVENGGWQLIDVDFNFIE